LAGAPCDISPLSICKLYRGGTVTYLLSLAAGNGRP
jgi:hypothetical protein